MPARPPEPALGLAGRAARIELQSRHAVVGLGHDARETAGAARRQVLGADERALGSQEPDLVGQRRRRDDRPDARVVAEVLRLGRRMQRRQDHRDSARPDDAEERREK
jgi:hypothetical protein